VLSAFYIHHTALAGDSLGLSIRFGIVSKRWLISFVDSALGRTLFFTLLFSAGHDLVTLPVQANLRQNHSSAHQRSG